MKRTKFVFIGLVLLLAVVSSSFYPHNKPLFAIKTVVIDAGHGGKDPGCHGKTQKEKDVALAIALKLGNYIEENLKDVKVVYTRKTDVFVALQERAEIANRAKADLFICIHCNSACVRDKATKRDVCRDEIKGAETYVMGIKNEKGKLDVAKRENSSILLEDDYVKKYDGFDPNSDESYIIMSMFNDTYLDQSLNFASKLQKQYNSKAGRIDKGVKRASLWVLWRTYMPSVLTEIGYLTNAEEEQFLGSAKGQNYVSQCIFRAFREYKDEIEGNNNKYDDDFEKQEAYQMSKEDIVAAEKEKKEKENDTSKVIKEVKTEKPLVNTEKPVVKENPVQPVVVKETVKEEKTETPPKTEASSALEYRVQFYSSEKKLPLLYPKFQDIERVQEYIYNGIYKYTAGSFAKKEDTLTLLAELKKRGFADAFIIMMKDGKRLLK
jgi:N-acetylmuramoyl-L-alanine amidase